jgi:polyribonucleotide nucleotidyltransferase
MEELKNKIRQTINNELNSILTTKLHDSSWEHINVVVNKIQDAIDEFDCAIEYIDSYYEGFVGDVSNSKIYEYVIVDIDGNEIMNVRLICSFCGTNDDPLGAYDITVLLDTI